MENNSAEYTCRFGPDNDGNYIEEIVKSSTALNCGGFCDCVGLANNICLLGPDANGAFVTRIAVASEEVDSCKRDWCTCNTHSDVVLLLADGQTTFDDIIASRTSGGRIIEDERVFDRPDRTPVDPVIPVIEVEPVEPVVPEITPEPEVVVPEPVTEV